MTKFHINKKGVPAHCKAKEGNCPLGGNEQHFETKEEAQKFTDERNKELYGIIKNEPNPQIRYNLKQLENAKAELAEFEAHTEEENPSKEESIESVKKTIDYYELLIDNERKGIFFDTLAFVNLREDDGSVSDGFIEDELDYLLEEYTVNPRGEVGAYMFLSKRHSHYGEIANNGKEGYMQPKTASLKRSIIRLMRDDNRVTLRDNDGVLEIVSSHHDGRDVSIAKPMTVSRMRDYERLIENGNVREIVDYLKNVPSIKIKKDKRFNV